jgi:hypothetical protein
LPFFGNCIFVLTEQNVYKYTLAGSFVSKFILPKTKEVIFNNIKRAKNGIINLSTKNSILKCQDVLQVYKLGNGLPYNIWSRDQIKVSKNEFTSNLVYNRSLTRLAQNIKTFRDNLNAKFIIATENARNNVVTYFSFLPISVQFEQPKLHPDVDSNPENVNVGVNELHLPPVLNREIEKLYTSLEIIADFLSIKNYTVSNKDCVESFCWSWNGTSCYNLSLPAIKTCNVNPISYKELELSQLGTIEYAPVPNNFPKTSSPSVAP